MKIAICYDNNVSHVWSTPIGFEIAMRQQGHDIDTYGINPSCCNMASLIENSNKYDFILFMIAGTSQSFDNELIRLRQNTKTKIFLEAGDDLPNSDCHSTRIHYVDGIFTPDYRCHTRYSYNKLPSIWFPCWCDELIFKKDVSVKKENICVTTCGVRPYVDKLQNIYGNRFINKRVQYEENTILFNSGTISYQYARYDEITRRLFEVGGCGLALLTNRISPETNIYTMFKEDENICYFSSEYECLEKMKLLFENEEYRNKISSNMYKYIIENHLVKHRVSTMIEYFNKL